MMRLSRGVAPDLQTYIARPFAPPEAAGNTRLSAPAAVMTITKCPIPARAVNRFTGAERELRQCGRTSDGWSALA